VGALALLAACSRRRRRAPAAAAAGEPIAPAKAAAPSAAIPMPRGDRRTAAGGRPAGGNPHPVPDRAAPAVRPSAAVHESSDARSDAELEFKQLSLAYPEYAGPQLNLGLLYLHDSRLPEAEAAFKARSSVVLPIRSPAMSSASWSASSVNLWEGRRRISVR